MTLSDGFKLSLNSVYGKSNDIHSFLYDPLYTLRTTINGQLMLCMLAERLAQFINGQILQINTDGITIRMKKEDIDGYMRICDIWEKETTLTLEYAEYSKMIIRDVNNYMAVDVKGKIKYKGAFEIDKEYHKDNSFRIIPLALSDYFAKGIPVEETVRKHTNIYDFCGRQKFGRDSSGEIHYLIVTEVGDSIEEVVKQQKNVRYYISNKGGVFIKRYTKGTIEEINKGFQVTVFNRFVEKQMEDYNINYNFYIKECNKILDTIENKQLTLFN